MAFPQFFIFTGSYTLSALALLRLILGLFGIYYYSIFAKRLDAVLYQQKLRQMTFVFFAVEALFDLLLSGLGEAPILLAARELGQLGVAYTVFLASQRILQSAMAAAAFVMMPSFLFRGIANIGGFDVDCLSVISIILVVWAIRNFSIYSAALKMGSLQVSARKLFFLSLLSSYVFQCVGVLLGVDIYFFVQLAETLAIGISFYAIRTVVAAGR